MVSITSKLRAKRIALLLSMIEVNFKKHGAVNIIDIGGTEKYWGIVPQEYLKVHNVKITIVNLPKSPMPEAHGLFRFVAANGCGLTQFEDKSFHIAHSNSVVEHVGTWQHMVQFANELSRVSEDYFVQTPNYWFPVEPHCMTPFFHWLPKPFRVWLVLHFKLGHWPQANSIDQAMRIVERARLLDRGMFQELFQEADILTERWLGLPKSFIAVKTG